MDVLFEQGRGYVSELFRQILLELFREKTYLSELFRQIKSYLPEPVPADKNLYAGTLSVCSLDIFYLKTGLFGQKE